MNSLPLLDWTEVSDLRRPAGDAIRHIDDSLRQASLPAKRYQTENGAQAIVVPSSSLLELAGAAKPPLPEDCTEVLFFAPGKASLTLRSPPTPGGEGRVRGTVGLAWPDTPRADDEVVAALGSSFRATAVGTWSLSHQTGKPQIFRLYRLTPIGAVQQKLFDSPARKLGETADNLEGRSRWFQKRQGKAT